MKQKVEAYVGYLIGIILLLGITANAAPTIPVVWVDLQTPDLKAASRFYTELLGFEVKDEGEGWAYLLSNKQQIGTIEQVASKPPVGNTTLYFEVKSLSAAYDKALRLGATSLVPPMAIPGEAGQGYIAVVLDPSNTKVGLYSPTE